MHQFQKLFWPNDFSLSVMKDLIFLVLKIRAVRGLTALTLPPLRIPDIRIERLQDMFFNHSVEITLFENKSHIRKSRNSCLQKHCVQK